MELDIEALISSCTPISSAPNAGEKSAFSAPIAPSLTVQPLTVDTQAPALFRNRSKRIRLLLFGTPNIPGHLGFDRISDGDIQDASGCYRLNGYSSTRFAWANNGESYRGVSVYMDASRVSSVYGASDAVQPSSLRSLVLVRAF